MVGEYDSNNLKNQFTFKVTFNTIIIMWHAGRIEMGSRQPESRMKDM